MVKGNSRFLSLSLSDRQVDDRQVDDRQVDTLGIERLRLSRANRSQLKIQQMAFMIVAVFFFFALAGLFVLSYYSRSLKGSVEQLQKDQAISSLQTLTDMPELSCGYLCLDVDKLIVMSGEDYEPMWPVASIKVYKVYPAFESEIECPGQDCNYYDVYDSGQGDLKEYSSFVSVCQKVRIGAVYEQCDIGKLVVGVIDVKE